MKSKIELKIGERQSKNGENFPIYTKEKSFDNKEGKQVMFSLSFNQDEFIYSSVQDFNYLIEHKLLTKEIANAFVKELSWYCVENNA